MNSLVIVGSGRSLLNSGLGNKIDSFENIIRFHGSDTHLEKYKEDVGIRTTSFVFNSNSNTIRTFLKKVRNGFIEDNPEITELIMTSTAHGGPIKWMRKTRQGKVLSRIIRESRMDWKLFTHNSARKVLQDFNLNHRNFSTKLRRRRRHTRGFGFTSGLIVLCNVLQFYDKIYLGGFDQLAEREEWFQGSWRQHFYNNYKLPLHRHRLGAEAKIIKALMKKTNKIEMLQS